MHGNIANFGGGDLTESLYGAGLLVQAVSVYPYGYPDDQIVADLIADSGGPGIVGGSDSAQINFMYLAGLVGCKNLGPDDEIPCLRKIPAQDHENALSWYSGNNTTPSISFKPIIDNKTAFDN